MLVDCDSTYVQTLVLQTSRHIKRSSYDSRFKWFTMLRDHS